MVRIRLERRGKKKYPFYWIVVIDSRKQIHGKYIRKLGYYDPMKKITKVDSDLCLEWLKLGGQCSNKVTSILKKENIYVRFLEYKNNNISKKVKNKRKNKVSYEKIKAKKQKLVARKKTRNYLLNNKPKTDNKEKEA